jgi:hypothetical protein
MSILAHLSCWKGRRGTQRVRQIKKVILPQRANVNVFTATWALPGTECESWRHQAMTEQPAKRIPTWLTIDLLIVVIGMVIIGAGIWIAPL